MADVERLEPVQKPRVRQYRRAHAVTAVVVLLFGAACSSKSSAAEVVAPDQLEAILLPAPDIGSIMGVANLQSDPVGDATTNSVKAVSIQDCLGAIYAAQIPVYHGSRFTAVSRDQISEPGDNLEHLVEQAAVSFSSASDALHFVKTSMEKWKTCAGQTVTATEHDNATTGWQLGQPNGGAPKITTVATQAGADGWACQRALDAVSNVVLDVTACGRSITDQAAQIVDKMAAKVAQKESAPTPQPAQSNQTTLPFSGLFGPSNVVIGPAGSLYVTDSGNHRVLKLAAGSNNETQLPFTGLDNPNGLAVDTAGDVYITDTAATRVLELAAGSNNQIQLPFTGLKFPAGICVDTAGSVYVTDYGTHQVLKLAAGSNNQTELPFTDLKDPDGVKVDAAGAIYVADGDNNRILKLPAGSSTATALPFTGLGDPSDVALDTAGNVYVTNHHNNRVVKLPAGSNTATDVPFAGLSDPTSAAIDSTGNIYITDSNNDRVVKLPPH